MTSPLPLESAQTLSQEINLPVTIIEGLLQKGLSPDTIRQEYSGRYKPIPALLPPLVMGIKSSPGVVRYGQQDHGLRAEDMVKGLRCRWRPSREAACEVAANLATAVGIEIISARANDLVYYIIDETGQRLGQCELCLRPSMLMSWHPVGRARARAPSQTRPMQAKAAALEGIILAPAKLHQIEAIISQVDHTSQIFKQWGFAKTIPQGRAVSLLFYGLPGTGKTMTAYAIARALGLELKVVQSADIQSSIPGEAERNIARVFRDAVHKQLILFDECDSLISDRNQVSMILAAEINALLTALDQYTGVVIFTTNRLQKLDPALERRITGKVEFPFPDQAAREAIWRNLIPREAPIASDVSFTALADYPLAGGNIKNVVLNAARKAAYLEQNEITMACFQTALEEEARSVQEYAAAMNQEAQHHALIVTQDIVNTTGRLEKAVQLHETETEGEEAL